MARYKVKVLGILGLNKKVFDANEIVTDSQFPTGVAEKLVSKGYLESLDKKGDKKKLDDAKAALVDAEKAYNDLYSELSNVTISKEKETDETKIAEIDAKIEKLEGDIKEAEGKLNKAKAEVKKYQ